MKSKKRADVYANFTVNHSRLDQLYTFDTFFPCRCNTNYLCLVHQHTADSRSIEKSFPTTRQLERCEIKGTPDYKTKLAWNKEKSVTLGDVIPTDKAKHDLL